VFDESTFRAIEIDLLQFLDATRAEPLKVCANRIFGYANQFRNQAMRQVVAFQPECFHPSLNQRDGMMISFIVQCVNDFRCEFDSCGHVRYHDHTMQKCQTKTAVSALGQYSCKRCHRFCWFDPAHVTVIDQDHVNAKTVLTLLH